MKILIILLLVFLCACRSSNNEKSLVIKMHGTQVDRNIQTIPVRRDDAIKNGKYSEVLDPESMEIIHLEVTDESVV